MTIIIIDPTTAALEELNNANPAAAAAFKNLKYKALARQYIREEAVMCFDQCRAKGGDDVEGITVERQAELFAKFVTAIAGFEVADDRMLIAMCALSHRVPDDLALPPLYALPTDRAARCAVIDAAKLADAAQEDANDAAGIRPPCCCGDAGCSGHV